MWILQRDISMQLFGMMMGVVRSASDLARQHRDTEHKPLYRRRRGMYTGGQQEDLDLELAFHGGARGGFQWLNCLSKDECRWVWASHAGEEETLQSKHNPEPSPLHRQVKNLFIS